MDVQEMRIFGESTVLVNAEVHKGYLKIDLLNRERLHPNQKQYRENRDGYLQQIRGEQ
jgi:hypothetical protein